MEQRRRSAHNAKVSQKLKELMQNKVTQKVSELFPKRVSPMAKSPLQTIMNKQPVTCNPESKPQAQQRPANSSQVVCGQNNKENTKRPSGFHSRKSSIDVGINYDKSNSSFQKPASQKSHSRILSMHENRSINYEQVGVESNYLGPRAEPQEQNSYEHLQNSLLQRFQTDQPAW